MFIAKCDRCGAEKHIENLFEEFQNANASENGPVYSVTEISGGNIKTVYLCNECQRELQAFIAEAKERKEHGED